MREEEGGDFSALSLADRFLNTYSGVAIKRKSLFLLLLLN